MQSLTYANHYVAVANHSFFTLLLISLNINYPLPSILNVSWQFEYLLNLLTVYFGILFDESNKFYKFPNLKSIS